MSLFSVRLFVMRRTASRSLAALKYVFILLCLFGIAMALFGHIVLGPTVHQWRALDTSIRNIIPMLRRADAFNIEAAKSIDDTVASVYGIFPVSSFFFVLSIFANTFILLNLTRAVVIFTYAKTDKQFWRKQPDDVTNDPFPNPLDFPREVYQRVTGFSMRRNLKKMRKKEYQGELKERKTRAREEAKEAVEEEIARQKALDEAKANPENGENGEEAENGGNGKA